MYVLVKLNRMGLDWYQLYSSLTKVTDALVELCQEEGLTHDIQRNWGVDEKRGLVLYQVEEREVV